MPIPSEFNAIEVESTNIRRIAYAKLSKRLFIEFKGGSTYVYTGVPETIYMGLLNAGSVGKFFVATVKEKFPFERI